MSGVALSNTTDSLPSPSNDEAIDLLWLKLASAEEEASKLSVLLVDNDSLMNHGDDELTNGSSGQSGDDALALTDTNWNLNTVSPILVDVPETDTDRAALIARMCRLESAVSSFYSTIVQVGCEHDHWRQGRLSLEEHFARAAKAFMTEFMRLCQDAESDCSKATETKEKAEQVAEELRNDLLQSANSLVSGDYRVVQKNGATLHFPKYLENY